MRGSIVEHLVVHLVGVNDQAILPRNGDDLTQNAIRIQGSGWIVRIDDDKGPGTRRDLAANIGEIR